MKTAQLKRSIIEAFEAILSELSASDIEDMQDKLTVQLYQKRVKY